MLLTKTYIDHFTPDIYVVQKRDETSEKLQEVERD